MRPLPYGTARNGAVAREQGLFQRHHQRTTRHRHAPVSITMAFICDDECTAWNTLSNHVSAWNLWTTSGDRHVLQD